MAEEKIGKYVAGFMMLVLATVVYFVGKNSWKPLCDGWGKINPACWFGTIGIVANIAFLLVGIWIALFGILMFALPSDKTGWAILLFVFLTGFVINVFIPDPIPFVDEAIMLILSSLIGIRTFSYTGKNNKQVSWGF